MKQKWIRAIESVEHFVKLAGLLQVPPKMLQEGIAWAKSIYCQEVVKKLIKERQAGKDRVELQQRLLEMSASPLFQAIRKLPSSVEGAKELFRLLDQNQDVKISHFKLDADSPSSPYLEGIYDWVKFPPALELAVRHLTNGKVNLFLAIDYGGEKQNFREMGITQEAAIDILQQFLFNIKDIVEEFAHFAKNFEGFSKNYIQQLGHVDAECRKHIKEGLENPYPLNLNLEDSKYFLPEDLKNLIASREGGVIKILCRFVFQEYAAKRINSEGNWRGLWNGSVFLFKDEKSLPFNSVAPLREELAEIGDTMRHELQHMMQAYIAEAKAIRAGYGEITHLPQAGLPGKQYRIPGYDQSGRPQSKQREEKERLQHELRDVEFYTNLTDNLGEYKRIVNQLPITARQHFFRTWTGQMSIDEFGRELDFLLQDQGRGPRWLNSFYPVKEALRRSQNFFGKFNATPKYGKAIKVLYSELLKLGLV